MTDKRLELTRRKLLLGTGTVGVAGAAAGLGTSALYQDVEQTENNTITAGTTNLIVEAAVVRVNTSNQDTTANGTGDGLFVDIEDTTADGSPAMGLTVSDMKPGDSVVIRFTVEVENNPMYVSLEATNTADSENAPNPEPEPSPGSDTGNDGLSGAGDLDNETLVTLGYDSDRQNLHDDTLEGSITPESGFGGGTSATLFVEALLSGFAYRGRNGADPSSGPPGGHADSGDLTRIGGNAGDSNVDREKVTHFVEFDLPESVGNQVQGDSFTWDLVWEAEQVRNNSTPLAGGASTLIVNSQTASTP